jgi:adenine-specific DNA-methyltransferase
VGEGSFIVKIDITKTELVWPGKYNENGTRKEVLRVSLPLQVLETINESRATREANKERQSALLNISGGQAVDTVDDGWSNKLIWGDNLLVMGSLLEKFAGKIDLIYIDPPFATGTDFSFVTQIGDGDLEMTKAPSSIEEKAYRDTWGAGITSYLIMMSACLALLRDLLSEAGSLFVHCDWHVDFLLRYLLNERFGSDYFLNEIVWYYYNKFQGNVHRFAANHDVIFWYHKGEKYYFTPQKEKRLEGKVRQIKRRWDKDKGTIVNMKGSDGKVLYQETDERTVDDVWRISMLQPADRTENTGFPTQKPAAILHRILAAATQPGALVADVFCGSGTTLVAAEKLGRRWIGCDLSRFAIHTTRKRLLGMKGCKPFEILNLGKYERQYWQGVTFGEQGKRSTAPALYAYLAFILKLYVAQPLAGLVHLHGKKGKAMVHIGAVDAPVTIDEINAAVAECVQVRQTELHVLGWEWEMGLYALMVAEAKNQSVKLLLLQIPREVMEQQAVDKGDIQFFERAYLKVEIGRPGKLTATIILKDFIISNMELLPEEVRSKIKKWSDYIDYWAVDWDFQNDTFMQDWVTYRTRRDRKLSLTSDPYTYDKPGRYRVLVKVVDIFGNDTSQAFDVEVQ